MMTDDLKRYYKIVNKNLVCSKSSRKRFMNETERLVQDFMISKPDATFSDIENFLGDPKTLSETFLISIDPHEIQYYKRKTKILKRAFVVMIVAVLIALCFIIYYIGHMRSDIDITQEIITTVY